MARSQNNDNRRAREGADAANFQAAADAVRNSNDPQAVLRSLGLTGNDAIPAGQEAAFAEELERQAKASRKNS